MRHGARSVTWVAAALLGLALHPAGAAGEVTIIRGSAVSAGGIAAEPGKPTIIRGIAPGTSWAPEAAPAAAAGPVPVARAGESLWMVDRDGALLACSLRGSGVVDRVSREVIVCTRARID